MKISYYFFMVLILVSQSCSVKDEEAPEILSVIVNGLQEEHPHALAGAVITIEIRATDNADLGQCKLTLNPSLHGHAEETTDPVLLQCPSVGEWDVLKIENMGGSEDVMIYSVIVPDSLQGAWNMVIEVADKGGNLSEMSLPLHIQNDFMPFIGPDMITPIPDEDGIVVLGAGESFSIIGDVVDTDDLALIDFTIWHEDTVYWNLEVMPLTWTYPLADITFPDMVDPGHFELIITATDMPGWTYYKWLEIHVE